MYVHITIPTLLLVLVVSTLAHPLEDSPPRRHFVANFRRASAVLTTTPNGTMLFDPAYVKNEIQKVLGKYSKAPGILDGIGLNPDTHPDTQYAAFNDTPIIQYFAQQPKTPPSSNVLAPQNPTGLAPRATPDDTIIGLPTVDYTDVHFMPLKDFIQNDGMDTAYHGLVQFGTPQQTLDVIVDTGSSDLWIAMQCPSCPDPQYDGSASSTFQNTGRRVTCTYGAGRIAGPLVRDTVSVGSLSVEKQGFVAARQSSADFMNMPSSGLLGMAFGSITVSKEPTFFENLLSQKKLPAGLFSVHMTRRQENGSELCFGCYDLRKTTGPPRWASVVSRTYWLVSMDGIASDPINNVPTDLVAAIDTGSTMVYVPDDVAKQFYATIPGSQDATLSYGQGVYTYPCASVLDITFSFAGQRYTMLQDDFNMGKLSPDSDMCVGGILGMGEGFPPNFAVIGDTFLKSWYTTYDYAGSKVGFAPSINNKH